MTGTNLGDSIRVYALTLTPAALAAALGATEQTFIVPGLLPGDVVAVSPPGAGTNCGLIGARVSAKDTLALLWGNLTAVANVPPGGVYVIFAIRP